MLKIRLKNPDQSAQERAKVILEDYREGRISEIKIENIDLFNALRLLVAQGVLAQDEVRFEYEESDEETHTTQALPVTVNKYGACPNWPTGMFGENLYLTGQILRTGINKKKAERE